MKRPTSFFAPVHCMIFGLSTYLVGIYFGQSLPAGIDMIALQSGLIGMLAFVGFSHRYNITLAAQAKQKIPEIEPTQVETRLERHVSSGQIRIDRGETNGKLSAAQTTQQQSASFEYGIR